MDKRFAIDIGGTFTDLVILGRAGNLRMAKVPSTPQDPSQGVVEATGKASLHLSQPEFFIHGTTLGVNTLLQHKGVKTGLITTDGFRDVLEIARLNWPLYRLSHNKPAPLVPRFLRFEVPERMNARGKVLIELDEEAVRRAVEKLKQHGVEAIAVCFLHAYANPAHEKTVAKIIGDVYPEVGVSLSHEVTREYREYERTATTVLNAYLQPVMERYVSELADDLTGSGFRGQFLITRCDGGLMSKEATKRRSLQTIHSGPASGVMGAAQLGELLGFKNIIAADMGGTSFDAALIINGVPSVEPMTKIEEIPILIPSIEIATIGAGGGSLARVDAGGALQVGPESAGADPGPICYGKGGTEPTFTDAALCNRLIDPGNFLGGEIQLDADAAQEGIKKKIAKPLGMNLQEASRGIMTILEAKMAGVLHGLCIGQGHDPREFVLVAYGGTGPMVAASLAEKIGVRKVLIPPAPANFSAWGMLMLDVVHDFSRTYVVPLNDRSLPTMLRELAQLQKRAARTMAKEGVPASKTTMLSYVDMRYEMQEHTVSVPVRTMSNKRGLVEALARGFQSLHEASYGYRLPYGVEVVNVRVRAVGTLKKPRLRKLPRGLRKPKRTKSTRQVWFTNSSRPVKARIYERSDLRAGNQITGPALVEEPTSVTLVGPGHSLRVDPYGNLTLDVRQ